MSDSDLQPLNSNSLQEVSSAIQGLLEWYNANQRLLPWRQTTDAYTIWLSEIILQQTKVSQGLPYFKRFVDRFPTVISLANADEQEVLRLWQGLGYYRRARNMHYCATQVLHLHNGVFPTEYHTLVRLKGIGKYTAAAIASFSGNAQVAVVDGNVYRVMSRFLGIWDDVTAPKSYAVFEKAMLALMPHRHSSAFNQAVMELGALVCTPTQPFCPNCPLASLCYAFSTKTQHKLPVKAKKKAKREEHYHYLVVRHEDRFMLHLRGDHSIWAGMYDFLPLHESENLLSETLGSSTMAPLVRFSHELTHKSLDISASFLEVSDSSILKSLYLLPKVDFYTREEIEQLPKSVVVLKILKELDHYLTLKYTEHGRS
jgi:A/G-specific adenine glycosylase